MLLEMVPDMPECAEDFLGLAPPVLCRTFHRSPISRRATLRSRPMNWRPTPRSAPNSTISPATMTSILTAVGAAMREAQQDKTRATLAEQATGWVKPLVTLAGGIINGATEADVDTIMANN